jgi:uncharacterized protein (TIGR03067 family)
MRQMIGMAVFLIVALPISADDKEDAAKKLNGTYEVTSILFEGKPDDAEKEKIFLIIKDGTIKMKKGNEAEKDDSTFTVDPTKTPRQIDLVPVATEEKQKETIHGIYELKETDKDVELTIVFREKEERPKDFKGTGMGEILIKMIRKKEK